MCGPSHLRLQVYTAEPVEFVHERCLGTNLGWTKATGAAFSPDSTKLLIAGEKSADLGEIAIFSVDGERCQVAGHALSGSEHTLEVHFLTRILSAPGDFRGTWFDNQHFLSGEFRQFSIS